MNVEASEIKSATTDDRGRIYLGTEFANKDVTVAIVDVSESGPSEDELAAAYKDAAENAETINEEWQHVSDEAWANLDE